MCTAATKHLSRLPQPTSDIGKADFSIEKVSDVNSALQKLLPPVTDVGLSSNHIVCKLTARVFEGRRVAACETNTKTLPEIKSGSQTSLRRALRRPSTQTALPARGRCTTQAWRTCTHNASVSCLKTTLQQNKTEQTSAHSTPLVTLTMASHSAALSPCPFNTPNIVTRQPRNLVTCAKS